MWHDPQVTERPFQERYRDLPFEHDPERIAAWEEGRTGYPIVDAAMHQVRSLGWMHNRARMVVASFVTKDLLLDYRMSEKPGLRLWMRCLSPWLKWAFAGRFDATTDRYLDTAGLQVLEQRAYMGDGVTLTVLKPSNAEAPRRSAAGGPDRRKRGGSPAGSPPAGRSPSLAPPWSPQQCITSASARTCCGGSRPSRCS